MGTLISQMIGFRTRNKIPVRPWKDKSNRKIVNDIICEYSEVGIVPSENMCVCIDIDMKNGVDGKKNLFKKFPNLPKSLNYKTASGGFHLWYYVPEAVKIPQFNGKLPGIDIRHADGYVCYRKDYKIIYDKIEKCPDYLLEWLKENKENKKKYIPSNNKKKSGCFRPDLRPFSQGMRNDQLHKWVAGLCEAVNRGEISESNVVELAILRGNKISGLPKSECEDVAIRCIQEYIKG